jgi:23S rRNA (uracil1939-C5)-methyltransferase
MPRYRPLPTVPSQAEIQSLAPDGRGVAFVEGKTAFIVGALPGETVLFRYLSVKKQIIEGITTEVITSSPQRVQPYCQHFGVCGGCNLQHLSSEDQIAFKQRVLLEQLHHIGKVQPQQVMPPLQGPVYGYRHKARLSVKYVIKKQTVIIGFREQQSHLVAELRQCEVLPPAVNQHFSKLQTVINQLEIRHRIAQIEIAVGDNAIALIIRHLLPLSEGDEQALRHFAQTTGFYIYLQSAGLNTITPLEPIGLAITSLRYRLTHENIDIHFAPHDFTQVNPAVNQQMVSQALAWLDPQPTDRVLDLFCGLGNFTLPLARRVAQVVAIDSATELLARAEANAHRQNIHNISYYTVNLADKQLQLPSQSFDKILLDPPRSGAWEVIQKVSSINTRRIVYVSCNPATLARDAEELVHRKGYHLAQVDIMDMFPHTAHVESMALFIL